MSDGVCSGVILAATDRCAATTGCVTKPPLTDALEPVARLLLPPLTDALSASDVVQSAADRRREPAGPIIGTASDPSVAVPKPSSRC